MKNADSTETETTSNPSPTEVSDAPTSPALVAPREAEVVNGEEVTFEWRPADEADAYLLQVASTAKFDDVLLERNLGEQTAATIADYFPTDGQTLFWRVLARSGDGAWSRGDRIESFIATTAETASKHRAGPHADEDMGPVTELVRAAGDDISNKMFESDDRFEREKEIGVAYEGIAAGQIMAIATSILLVIAVAIVIVINWAATWTDTTRQSAIDPSNYTTLQEAEIDAANQLQQYDVVNEEEGIYRIPIDQAMDIIATDGYQQNQSNGQNATDTTAN